MFCGHNMSMASHCFSHLGRTRRTWRTLGFAVAALLVTQLSLAQSALNGKLLYNSELVRGELTCGSGSCHGPNPSLNINKVKNGDTPGGIANAANNVVQMRFLRGQLSAATLTDLAAYIDNPSAASGPLAQAAQSSLSFGTLAVGASSSVQTVTIYNIGTSALTVSGVSSSLADFSISANTCSGAIAADGSCTFNVVFAPSVSGARSADITVQHNAAIGNPLTISVNGTGTGSAQTTASLSISSLEFDALFVGQSSRAQTLALTNSGGSPLTISSVNGANAHFSLVDLTCVAGLVIAPGSSCFVDVAFSPQSAAVLQATLTIAHNGVGGASSANATGVGRALPANARLAIEYRIPSLDYYFITSRETEQSLLDSIASFGRTGQSFAVFGASSATTRGITRYYFDKVAKSGSRGSHFYTLIDAEIAALNALNPANAALPKLPLSEGIDSYATPPTVEGVGGSCPVATLPVYRIFRGNQRFPDDPNHRFTIDRRIYDDFVAAGWDGEGVKFCAIAP
jgi:hypothetical protein